MPPLTSKNLGLVRAIHSGTTAPTNIKMLWYNENDYMHYYYDIPSSTWKLLASTGSGGTQTLSQTLALGNTTGANDINITAGRKIIFNNSGFTTGLLANPALGVNTTVYLPSQSGTLALVSDIPSLAYSANLVIKGTGGGIASGIIFDNGSSVSIGTTFPAAGTKFTVKSGISSVAVDIINSSNLSNFSVNDDGTVVSRLGYWLNLPTFGVRKVIWAPENTSYFIGMQSGQSGNLTSASANNGFGMRSLYNVTTGYNNNAFGFDALFNLTTGTNNLGIGTSSIYNVITGSDNIGIGLFAGANLSNPSRSISIGGNSKFFNPSFPLLNATDTIVIGYGVTANASDNYEALIGGSELLISNLYIGQGRWSSASTILGPVKIQVTSPIPNSNSIGLTAQTNASGVDFIIAGSQPTGSGNGGSLLFQIAPGGGASGTAARSLVTTLKLTSTKSIIAGGVLGTTATDGFVYISSAPGAPTGTPTTQVGTVPLVVDTVNNRLYFYSSGAWNYSSGGGTVYSAGAGLNLTGTIFSIATSGIVNSMIANSTIDLTSKVTGILPQGNGGTGFATYTKGDLLIGDTGNVLVKLGVGSDGQVLTVSGGTAIWSTASSLGPLSSGQIYLGNASNATALVTPTGDITISNTGVTAIGAGKVTNTMIVSMAASKLTGVVAANQGGTGISTYTTGDLLYYGASSFSKLAVGTNGQVLTIVSGAPAWANAGASSGWNLDGSTVTSEKWFGTIDNFDIPFRTNSVERVRLTTTGRLGIGTVAPSTMLDIVSTTAIGGISLNLGAGAVGIAVNANNALGLNITSSGGGILVTNTHGSMSGIQVVNTGSSSTGIMVDTLSGIGISVNSKFYTAGLFSQTGSLTANNTSDLLALYRNFSLNAFDATGSVLLLNDDTASTGNFLTIVKQNVTKLAIKSTGVFQYIDGNQASGKVLTSDASGNATWQTAGGGTSYTFSTGLTNTSGTITNNLSTGVSGGQSVIGGIAANNALTLSSTSNASKGKIIFGTASCYNEFNDRLGIGTTLPGAKADFYIANGGTGLRITNADATTTAGGTIVGWYWSPVTNGTDTNIDWYEQTAAGGLTKRGVWHKGGNHTIGAGSGNGDAKLHVIGTLKVEDGSQGVDKIFRSDANGLGSWITAPWITNVLTTIADIIQADTGGTPVRLAGSATAGTFLRSQGSGVLNHWSTLVLPNAATTGQLMWATGTNTMGMTSEMVWTSAFGTLVVTKSRDGYSTISINNSNTGTSAAASVAAISDIADITLVANGSGNSRDGGGARTYLQSSGIDMNIINTNNVPIKFIVNASETLRITSAGVLIGINTAANPDASCLLDLNSTTKGLRVPRMTTTERNAINITGKPGIIVYDTTTNLLYVSNSSAAWVSL